MRTTLAGLVRRYRLVGISFVTGYCLLSYELAAARILAPSIGSSTYVWTGVIGVIIAALSLGFFVGGKLADRRHRASDLVILLLLASATSVLTLLSYQGMLDAIVGAVSDSRVQAVIAALTLFAPTSFLIGITSPYLAKLNVRSLETTGQSIASLDMFNAIGGIVGTFVTGFILFGFIGSHQTIGLVALLLLAMSWLILPRRHIVRRAVISGVVALLALTPASYASSVTSVDTASAHYKIIQGFLNDRPVTGLITGPTGTQSAVYTNGSSEPVFWYVQEAARLTIDRQPSSVLVLGGGAFTLPQYLGTQLPEASVDVVEIDPALEGISEKYFNYTQPSNVRELFTDARAYVNQTDERYDVIIVDVYGDSSIPFTFMTKEYGEAIETLVADDGIVIANVIGGLEGACRESLTAVDAAYRVALPSAQYVADPSRDSDRANYIIVYSREAQSFDGLNPLNLPAKQAFTDNFAPAEQLHYACQRVNQS